MTTGEGQPVPDAGPVHRPGPLRWIWYAVGGRLPDRHRGWVLQDATRPRWMLRHAVRALVQLAVPIAVVLLLPGPLEIRLFAAAAGLLIGVFFGLAYATETVEHRVRRAGFPAGLAEAMRARTTREREARRSEALARRTGRRT